MCKPSLLLCRFPKDGKVRQLWEAALRRKGFTASPSSRLCSNHFIQEDFDRTGQTVRLRAGAFPSVFSYPAHLQKVGQAKRPYHVDEPVSIFDHVLTQFHWSSSRISCLRFSQCQQGQASFKWTCQRTLASLCYRDLCRRLVLYVPSVGSALNTLTIVVLVIYICDWEVE